MFASLRRSLPVVLGLLLLALFVWFAGPYFAFADWHPLEPVLARVIVIVAIVALWAGVVLGRRMRANRKSDQLAEAIAAPPPDAPRPSADVVQLRERFDEAIATLKGKRKSGHTLYELPWYVIIGPPGSGKTTALANSGLHFPLEHTTGRNALRGVGGTRNCDWWFTEEAVFLDTAGRFFTQDSDAAADSAGWREFLLLLKKFRTRRPVNGIILTVSAPDLLMPAHVDLEGQIDATRRRLKELNDELKIQLPVYLMVTKCDLVSGFTEHFDDLSQEGRAQVWGVTFPYEQTTSGEAAGQFPTEFDALIERLNGRLFARVEEDRDVKRRTRIFGFPQQLALLRDSLAQFVQAVFTPSRYDSQQTLLRGVYFTSGTQEGTPIDRLLGAIGRRFAMAPEAVAPSGRGKAYFIQRLLKDVIFAESGIAGINRRLEFRKAALQLGAYLALIAFAVIGVIVLSVSYARNRAYVQQVEAEVEKVNQVVPATAAASLDDALPRLDAIRGVVDVATLPDAPLSMRWGLFQGRSLAEAVDAAYARELNGSLLPHVAERFRQRLIQNAAQPEALYEYLKAYLMLGMPEHLNKEHLASIASLEWEVAYSDVEQRQRVADHFQRLLDQGERLRPVTLDQTIVTQARNALQQAPKGELIYRYLRIERGSDPARTLRLDQLAGINAERVLRRRSGVSLAEPVPALYTKPVFEEVTKAGLAPLVKQFFDEYWVWGDSRPQIAATASLFNEVLDLYEKDYIRVWDAIVNDIAVAPLPTLSQTKEAVSILSSPTSPLRGLLKVVDDNTYFVAPQDPAAQKGAVRSTVESVLKKLGPVGAAAAGAIPTVQPGAQITAYFEPIHRLLAGDAGAAPIDGLLQRLNQLQQQLAPVGTGVGETPPGDPRSINAIGEVANSLKRDAAALPPSVGAVVTQVANGATAAVRSGVANTLETRYRQEVVSECTQLIANRYPFSPNGPDVLVADFRRVFGPNGVFDGFFKTELANLVDTSRSPWRWLADASGAPVGGSTQMLRRFEEAEAIRNTFFASGTGPELAFTVVPQDLDPGAVAFRFEVDGQQLEYRHDAPRPVRMSWPGPKPPNASVTFVERSGTPPFIMRDGVWAWFKLMDAAQVRRLSDDRYVMVFEAGGHRAEILLQADSVRNPFGKQVLQQFRCA